MLMAAVVELVEPSNARANSAGACAGPATEGSES